MGTKYITIFENFVNTNSNSEDIKIISPQTIFKKRSSIINKKEEDIKIMKEINDVSFKIYTYLINNNAKIKKINDYFDKAEEIELFDYWVNQEDWGTLTYVNSLDLLNFLRTLQKEYNNIIIGYNFIKDVKIKLNKTNNILIDLFGPDHVEKPFNLISSIVIASPDHKKMWRHVTWNLSTQNLKKMGWQPLPTINKNKRLK